MLRSLVRMLPATRGAGVTAAASPFAQAAPNLSALGWAPIPIVPPSVTRIKSAGKAPGSLVAGHWQAMAGWSKFRDCPPTTFQMSLWMQWPEAGCGVLLGTPAGVSADGERLVLIGIDIDQDGDALDTLLRCLPTTPTAKAGNVGQTRFFRASEKITSRSYDRAPGQNDGGGRLVDLLAGGRQSVVPGSVHAKTGTPYVWIGEPVEVQSLPIFTESDLEVLEENLEMLGWERPDVSARPATSERTPRARGDYGSDEWAETNGEALARLGEWILLLNLPKTRQTRSGTWTAVPTWRASNSGRPDELRKANLSASSGSAGVPAGIRDWGASGTDASLTAIDLVQRALDLSAGEAKDWLRETLGLNEEDGFAVDFSGMLAAQEQRAVQVEVPATVGIVSHATEAGMPQHLIDGCPGLLGGIAQFITASARKPQPTFSLAAAIMILGTAAGRVYAGPTDSGTHLYSVICGASGVGKDHPLDMAARILEACDMGMHVGPGEFMSFQAVYKTLSRQPLLLCPMDELGSFLARLSKKGAAGNEAAVTGVMRTAWGKSFGSLQVPGWATQDMPTIYAPAMSIIGASTPQEFFRSLESGSIDNGFLNRWLLFPSYLRPDAVAPAVEKFVVPQQIIDGIKAVYNAGSAMTRATMHNGRCDTPFIRASWEGGPDGPLAREYRLWSSRIDEQSDTESLFARVSEQTIRVATIRAIGNDAANPVVDRASLAWARELVLWSTQAMVSQSADFMAENQTQADRARVLRAIKRHGTITHRDLTRSLTTFKARDLDDMVKLLEVAELIAVSREVNPSNGKTTRRYTYVGGE